MGADEAIRSEVLSWPGVTEAPHRFGGVEFCLGKRELGHLHGDYLADLPFPVRIREELVRDGKAMPHHILPQSGWVSYPIRDASAVPGALDLFRLAYQRATGLNHRDTEDTEKRREDTRN
ncbi:MAG: luciferase family protein [Thermomicrobiales bacterium]